MPLNRATYDSSRMRQPARVREILRISADVEKPDVAREIILEWLENEAGTDLPEPAWKGRAFQHGAVDRSFTAVRAKEGEQDTWSLRFVGPDPGGADREWTTEVAIRERKGAEALFSVRTLVKSEELKLRIQPTVPGFMEHVASECGLDQGGRRADQAPWVVGSDYDAAELAEFLSDPNRQSPAFVLTVPEDAEDPNEPLLDPVPLQADTLGIARVIVLPADYTWKLTNRFGKRLSVYRGAMRVYLPGFSEHASPEGGHDLFMPHRMETPENAAKLGSLLRWMAARESLRRLRLDQHVLPFASVLLPSVALEATRLSEGGASEAKQLAAIQQHMDILGEELRLSLQIQQWLTEENKSLESRVREAESKLRGLQGRGRRPMDRPYRDQRSRPRYSQPYGRQQDSYRREGDSHRQDRRPYSRDDGPYPPRGGSYSQGGGGYRQGGGGYRQGGGGGHRQGGGGGHRQGGGWGRRGR